MHPHIEHIPHISALLAGLGLRQAVLSPGSRCAPLVLSFTRQPEIACYSVVDERSAGFIALGMAQQSGLASALICTSGTAGLNYAPAVAEAFYQELPLLILTADRPAEWIDRWDGQTIRQEGMYGRHVKASFTLPEHGQEQGEQALEIIRRVWEMAHAYPCGPVHVNVPMAEPFYPEGACDWPVYPAAAEAYIPPAFLQGDIPEALWHSLKEADRVLCVAGHQVMSAEMKALASALDIFPQISLIHDVISNGFDVEGAMLSHDLFLSSLTEEQKEVLRPDVLITTGKSLISKNLKLFLRAFPPREHWHVDTREHTPDPFGTLTGTIQWRPEAFFRVLTAKMEPKMAVYRQQWAESDNRTRAGLDAYAQEAEWSEWKALYRTLQAIPGQGVLHLANSMAVRYVNFFAHTLRGRNLEVQANRGTSGIDGSNGTAVGFSLVDGRMQTLITGDLAFLYDPNAFWHAYPMANLRIIVLNNGGGGIFRMIDGPARLPELETWFETRHERKAKEIAGLYGWKYLEASDVQTLDAALKDLYLPGEGPALLEIFSNPSVNKSVFQVFKKRLRDYEF